MESKKKKCFNIFTIRSKKPKQFFCVKIIVIYAAKKLLGVNKIVPNFSLKNRSLLHLFPHVSMIIKPRCFRAAEEVITTQSTRTSLFRYSARLMVSEISVSFLFLGKIFQIVMIRLDKYYHVVIL